MLRRSATVALAVLIFLLLAVSPSRGFCASYVLDFANVPAETTVEVGPGAVISIVGELWRTDCAADPSGGAGCYGSVERPLKNITVELVGAAESVVIAEGISATGENETWLLNFRVPDLPEGTYRIHVHADGAAGGEATNDLLSLRISRDGPRGGPAAT
jgi:hypothetical protein